MPKLDPIVNQEPKDQLVPTFNKKEVAEIAQDAVYEKVFIDCIALGISDEKKFTNAEIAADENLTKLVNFFTNLNENSKVLFIYLRHEGYAYVGGVALVINKSANLLSPDGNILQINYDPEIDETPLEISVTVY